MAIEDTKTIAEKALNLLARIDRETPQRKLEIVAMLQTMVNLEFQRAQYRLQHPEDET